MKKSRSPKKSGPDRKSSEGNWSILEMFKKQKSKSEMQKQSELNWIESNLQGNFFQRMVCDMN